MCSSTEVLCVCKTTKFQPHNGALRIWNLFLTPARPSLCKQHGNSIELSFSPMTLSCKTSTTRQGTITEELWSKFKLHFNNISAFKMHLRVSISETLCAVSQLVPTVLSQTTSGHAPSLWDCWGIRAQLSQ